MAGCPDYYFKRRIVTENLYGVDIEKGALANLQAASVAVAGFYDVQRHGGSPAKHRL